MPESTLVSTKRAKADVCTKKLFVNRIGRTAGSRCDLQAEPAQTTRKVALQGSTSSSLVLLARHVPTSRGQLAWLYSIPRTVSSFDRSLTVKDGGTVQDQV